jgi:hypothetical protein
LDQLLDLVINELVLPIDEKTQAAEKYPPVLSSAWDQLQRCQQDPPDEDKVIRYVSYWLLLDLQHIGGWLMSEGVELNDLRGLLTAARRVHIELAEGYLLVATQPEYRIDAALSIEKDRDPDKYFSWKKGVKRIIEAVVPGPGEHGSQDTQGAWKDVSDAVSKRYGRLGVLLAIENIKGRHDLSRTARELLRRIKLQYRCNMATLSVAVVDLLQRKNIRPVYRTGCRLLESLLCKPEFPIDRDEVTYKSKGEDKLRKLYAKEKGKRTRKKGS